MRTIEKLKGFFFYFIGIKKRDNYIFELYVFLERRLRIWNPFLAVGIGKPIFNKFLA